MSLRINGWLLVCSLIFLPFTIKAAPAFVTKPFYASSMQEIFALRQGKPFIVGLWSLSCSHCRDDLILLASLSQQYPQLDLVLIATDTLDDADTVQTTLATYKLNKTESWVFADDFTEQLRYSIDRRWQGELPRTYFYDASHQARAISGKLDAAQTRNWVQAQYAR
jgi:thiol-disulfide isomerase/thioredoxin